MEFSLKSGVGGDGVAGQAACAVALGAVMRAV